jgi:hypothetical protein
LIRKFEGWNNVHVLRRDSFLNRLSGKGLSGHEGMHTVFDHIHRETDGYMRRFFEQKTFE